MAISNRLKKKLDLKRQRDAVAREILRRPDPRSREIVRRALEGWPPAGWQKGADHGNPTL